MIILVFFKNILTGDSHISDNITGVNPSSIQPIINMFSCKVNANCKNIDVGSNYKILNNNLLDGYDEFLINAYQELSPIANFEQNCDEKNDKFLESENYIRSRVLKGLKEVFYQEKNISNIIREVSQYIIVNNVVESYIIKSNASKTKHSGIFVLLLKNRYADAIKNYFNKIYTFCDQQGLNSYKYEEFQIHNYPEERFLVGTMSKELGNSLHFTQRDLIADINIEINRRYQNTHVVKSDSKIDQNKSILSSLTNDIGIFIENLLKTKLKKIYKNLVTKNLEILRKFNIDHIIIENSKYSKINESSIIKDANIKLMQFQAEYLVNIAKQIFKGSNELELLEEEVQTGRFRRKAFRITLIDTVERIFLPYRGVKNISTREALQDKPKVVKKQKNVYNYNVCMVKKADDISKDESNILKTMFDLEIFISRRISYIKRARAAEIVPEAMMLMLFLNDLVITLRNKEANFMFDAEVEEQ